MSSLHLISTMANQPKTRLDMRHGFMKCIIKNQVERDNYDREVKAKLIDKPRHVLQNKNKKPEIQTYIPPSKAKTKKDGVLFDLEYLDETGTSHFITLNKGDDIEDIAQTFGEDVGLTPPLIEALKIKIYEEADKRTSEKTC